MTIAKEKPKFLAALILSLSLAISGVGTALAAEDIKIEDYWTNGGTFDSIVECDPVFVDAGGSLTDTVEIIWNDGTQDVGKTVYHSVPNDAYVEHVNLVNNWGDDLSKYTCRTEVTVGENSASSAIPFGDPSDAQYASMLNYFEDTNTYDLVSAPVKFIGYGNGYSSPMNQVVYSAITTEGFVDDNPDTTPVVSFKLNFNATGIQATGFADYKEAFAALNSGN